MCDEREAKKAITKIATGEVGYRQVDQVGRSLFRGYLLLEVAFPDRPGVYELNILHVMVICSDYS